MLKMYINQLGQVYAAETPRSDNDSMVPDARPEVLALLSPASVVAPVITPVVDTVTVVDTTAAPVVDITVTAATIIDPTATPAPSPT